MVAWWTFQSYVTARGDRVLQQWYEGLDDKAQAVFDTRLRYLRQQPVSGWTRPYVDHLEKEYAGLIKIRLKVRNVQLRPLGFISGASRFTFVYPEATERDGKWNPRNAPKIAKRRMQDILGQKAQTDDYEFE